MRVTSFLVELPGMRLAVCSRDIRIAARTADTAVSRQPLRYSSPSIGTMGKVKRNVLPLPGVLSAQICPPCA